MTRNPPLYVVGQVQLREARTSAKVPANKPAALVLPVDLPARLMRPRGTFGLRFGLHLWIGAPLSFGLPLSFGALLSLPQDPPKWRYEEGNFDGYWGFRINLNADLFFWGVQKDVLDLFSSNFTKMQYCAISRSSLKRLNLIEFMVYGKKT